jgi:GxxExxY protein
MGGTEDRKQPGLQRLNALSHAVIGAAIEVHRALGPGVLESVYEESLCMELHERGIPFLHQHEVTVRYKDRAVGTGRIDLLVRETIIVELKAVDALADIHTAQLLSYLRVTGLPLGLLINFNVKALKDGVRRIALSPDLI